MSEYSKMMGQYIYRYALAEWRGDRIVIVMSELGVVDVAIGETDDEVLSQVCRRFPNAGFVPDRGLRAAWVRGVLARLERPATAVLVPLDLGGRGSERLSPCA